MNALLAAVLVLAAVPWHSSPDAAVAAARTERKILLVHYRGSCGNCNDAADRTMESAAADPVFQQALGSFVPLRVTAAQPEAKRYDDLFLRNRQPVLAFFTSDGLLLHWIENPNRG
ncbi:MAG TPA: hypothetical protein VHK90_14315, partial [Thermoanaerobaculia bacterium]|nr:hypothetical protein [Thermoanaerobaculia bacterium]